MSELKLDPKKIEEARRSHQEVKDIARGYRYVYQAGYYSGNSWLACGYGLTKEESQEDLKKCIENHAKSSFSGNIDWATEFFKGHKYKEQRFKEIYDDGEWM